MRKLVVSVNYFWKNTIKHWRVSRRLRCSEPLQFLPTNYWFGSITTKMVVDQVVQVPDSNFNLKRALKHLPREHFKELVNNVSPQGYILQCWQIEKWLPVSEGKNSSRTKIWELPCLRLQPFNENYLLIQPFLISVVKIQHTLLEYPAPAPSSEPVSPKTGLEAKPEL